ncbi:MAG: hypothetical protein GY869_30725, partial [Planctomycetes bacterium]|nr:hypothetical protein [Planctomycetota bacterium]
SHYCSKIQNGYQLIYDYMKQIPIPAPTPNQRTAIETLVQQLLDLEGRGAEVAALEAELNRLVYEVYGLTAEEIELIEETLKQ